MKTNRDPESELSGLELGTIGGAALFLFALVFFALAAWSHVSAQWRHLLTRRVPFSSRTHQSYNSHTSH